METDTCYIIYSLDIPKYPG